MTTSQNQDWAWNKQVLVYATDSKVSCRVGLRIAHDENAEWGSITLSIAADLANSRVRSQVRLNIPPDRVKDCELYPKSTNSLCPSDLVTKHPASIKRASALSTLRLELSKAGIVLCPSDVEHLSPVNERDPNLDAFGKICASQYLCLYIAQRQFAGGELDKLKVFTCALREKRLQNESFDHARQDMVQRDWRVFCSSFIPPSYSEDSPLEQVDPPPYCETPVSGQVIRKRRRESISTQIDNKRREIPLLSSPPPKDSSEISTEAATPSPSPSIRPTYFTRAVSPGRTERNRFTCLVHVLRSLPDDLIGKLLDESGHGHLLNKWSIPEVADSDLPSESEKVKLIKRRRLKGYVDKIKRDISQVFDEILDGAESKFDDWIYEQCDMHGTELREELDEGISEVRNKTDECIKEIEEAAEQCVHEIEGRKDQCMNDIQHQGIEVGMSVENKLKHRFNASSRLLLDSESSPSHEPGTDARRSSI